MLAWTAHRYRFGRHRKRVAHLAQNRRQEAGGTGKGIREFPVAWVGGGTAKQRSFVPPYEFNSMMLIPVSMDILIQTYTNIQT